MLNTAVIFAQIWNQFCFTALVSLSYEILCPYFPKSYTSPQLLKTSIQSISVDKTITTWTKCFVFAYKNSDSFYSEEQAKTT